MKTYVTGYQIYKPTKSGKGSVLQLNPAQDFSCIFLEITNQNGDNAFDWERKIVMKLGTNDILTLMYTLEMVRTLDYKHMLATAPEDLDAQLAAMCKDGNLTKLFHMDKSKGSSSVLNVKPNDSKYGGGFRLLVSKKVGNDSLSHAISISPIETLGFLDCLQNVLNNKRFLEALTIFHGEPKLK